MIKKLLFLFTVLFVVACSSEVATYKSPIVFAVQIRSNITGYSYFIDVANEICLASCYYKQDGVIIPDQKCKELVKKYKILNDLE